MPAESPSTAELLEEIALLKARLRGYETSKVDTTVLTPNADIEALRLRLISSEFDNVDDVLAFLHRLLNIDGIFFYQYDILNKYYHLRSCFPSGSNIVNGEKVEGVPIDGYRWTFDNYASKGLSYCCDNVSEMPETLSEFEMMRGLGFNSFANVPVMLGYNLQGLLGVVNRTQRVWTDHDIQLLEMAAPIIQNFSATEHSSRILEWMDKAGQISATASSVNELEDLLESFAQLMDIDDIQLQAFDSNFFKPLLSFPREELAERDESYFEVGYYFPWADGELLAGRDVIVRTSDDIPAEETVDKQNKIKHGFGSSVNIAISKGSELQACFSAVLRGRERIWTAQEVSFLRRAAHLFFTSYQQLSFRLASESSEHTLQLVLNTTQVGYVLINRDGSYYFYSDNASEVLGLAPDINLTPDFMRSQVIQKDKLKAHNRWLLKGFKDALGEDKSHVVIAINTGDGKKNYMMMNRRPYRFNDDGSVDVLLIGFTNVTNLMEKQLALAEAQMYADQANVAKGEFLARMSHEIRTPMNAIMGMSNLVKGTPLTDEQHDRIEHIEVAAGNLLGIINDVLDFSKIESGKMSIESTTFELEKLLTQITQVASFGIGDKDVELVLSMQQSKGCYLKGDPLRLNQILTNLISNAVKFTAKGTVNIDVCEYRRTEDSVELEFRVSDQGIGISADQQEHLFEPFVQADGSTSRRFGGTGLGLTIVKRLMDMMGGVIKLDSTVGVGSCFSCLIPFEIHNAEHYQPLQLSERRTLVVDDNDDARKAISAMASSLGLDVASVANGEKALALLDDNHAVGGRPFELLLLDYRMPVLDGLAVAEAVKASQKLSQLPTIIMVSAYDKELIREHKASKNIDAYLNKPVSLSRLHNTIDDLWRESKTVAVPVPVEHNYDELAGLRVLLVEDNHVNQLVAVGLLNKHSINCRVVNDGLEAVNLLSSSADDFDLVLMDLEMPNMDGHEATQVIRQELNLDLPVVAMTAHAMRGDRERSLASGLNDHITKPINPQRLAEVLKEQWLLSQA